ncbi:MAG: hypothetical protein DYH03_03090 [Nitrospira sp. NTP1]|nr:hypothetical protein [Nitrospira sp. NTP1]
MKRKFLNGDLLAQSSTYPSDTMRFVLVRVGSCPLKLVGAGGTSRHQGSIFRNGQVHPMEN